MAGFTVKLRLREIDPFENFMFTSLSSLESASWQQAVVRGVVDIHSFDH
jgi:hypothetical protein